MAQKRRFDRSRLALRSFEVQIHYHAAYLYWNLKGVIAERWAHGPHFGAYAESRDNVRLTAPEGQPSDRVGTYGLRASAFRAEFAKRESAEELGQLWIEDCLTVLRPRLVNTMTVRYFYSYPTPDPQRVSDGLALEFPSVLDLMPQGAGAHHGGVQFQFVEENPPDFAEKTTSGIFGVFGPAQSREYFISPERFGDWHLGLNLLTLGRHDQGIQSPKEVLGRLLAEQGEHAENLVNKSLVRVLSRVGI